MPRPAPRKTPLRLFREATGHSQKTFAHEVGDQLVTSLCTYKAYENGVRPVPRRFAVQLMVLFGVDPVSIMAKCGIPRDLSGRRYSRRSFETWPGERVYGAHVLPAIIQRVSDRIVLMLLAARRSTHFTLALEMFEECLASMHNELHLHDHFRAVSNGGKPFEPWGPIKIYTAGAPVRVPEEAIFPLGKEALHTIARIIAEAEVCAGDDRAEFDRNEREFFSTDSDR